MDKLRMALEQADALKNLIDEAWQDAPDIGLLAQRHFDEAQHHLGIVRGIIKERLAKAEAVKIRDWRV